MTAKNHEGTWEGYKKLLLPMGHKADVNNLTTLSSIIVDRKEGKVNFLHVMEEGKYSHLPQEWRVGSKRVTESHHIMMRKGLKSERSIVTSSSILDGILEEAEKKDTDGIVLGWGPKPKSSISKLISKIMSRANCDVIVFKTRNDPAETKNIVYPVAREPNQGRLKLISRIMADTDSSLTFVHVTDRSDKNQKQGKEVLKKSVARANKTGIESETMITYGNDVSEKLSEISRDYDLMILGPSGGWWLTRTLFGHLTDKIASRVNCSVLLHKNYDEE
ncbi:MAG: universal stress protein [Bacillota bacterium]